MEPQQRKVMEKPLSALYQGLQRYVAEKQPLLLSCPCVKHSFDDTLLFSDPAKFEPGAVEVTREDTLVCAERLHRASPGSRIAVLNMANPNDPGLDCTCETQEEVLLFRTALGTHGLDLDLYPIEPDSVLVSQDVPVLLDPQYQPLAGPPFVVDVISACAPQLPRHRHRMTATEIVHLRRTIDLIFRAASHHGAHVLVLGPLGNGAFNNPASTTIALWNEALMIYRGCFDRIVFACKDDERGANFVAYSQKIQF